MKNSFTPELLEAAKEALYLLEALRDYGDKESTFAVRSVCGREL